MSLWPRTLEDLAFSLFREWRREIMREDSEVDYTGLVDAFMISVVVGRLLLGWGWMGATLALGLEVPRNIAASDGFGTPVAIILVTFLFAILVGVLSAMVVSRNGRVASHPIKV